MALPPPPSLSVEFKAYMLATYNGDDDDDPNESTGEDMITVGG